MKLRIGTRRSTLALKQTKEVCDTIAAFYPNTDIEVVKIVTTGDRITDRDLYDMGGKALFLREIEQQLLENKIDLAVHSLKDVPGILLPDLHIAAVLERCDARDVLVSKHYRSIDALPNKAIVGTSSIRRKVIMQSLRPDIVISSLRGNVDTRLDKLNKGDVDATILAAAGLIRLGIISKDELLNNRVIYQKNLGLFFSLIDETIMLPPAGQGIICVETRKEDRRANEISTMINHAKTFTLSQAERSFLEALGASCDTPVSAYAKYIGDDVIEAKYMIADRDGYNIRYHTEQVSTLAAMDIGFIVAKKLVLYDK